MKGRIEFVAEVGPWVCIKKQQIDKDVQQIEIARMLASIHDSMDRKIWHFIGEDFPIDRLDQIVAEIVGAQWDEKKKTWIVKGRKSEAQICSALARLANVGRLLPVKGKWAAEIQKAYITRRVLELLGFRLELDPQAVDKYLEEKGKGP